MAQLLADDNTLRYQRAAGLVWEVRKLSSVGEVRVRRNRNGLNGRGKEGGGRAARTSRCVVEQCRVNKWIRL